MNPCPTCGDQLGSALASCRKPACLAEDLRREAVYKRGEDE